MAAATMVIYEYESDLRSNEHYFDSCENKARKKKQAPTGFEFMDIHFFLRSSHI